MTLDVLESGQSCTIRVKGSLKMGEPLEQFDAAIFAAFQSGHHYLILNLEAVPVIDSSGIGSVVNALQRAQKLGGDVVLVNPSPFTIKTFKMVHILNLFKVYENEAAALASCQI